MTLKACFLELLAVSVRLTGPLPAYQEGGKTLASLEALCDLSYLCSHGGLAENQNQQMATLRHAGRRLYLTGFLRKDSGVFIRLQPPHWLSRVGSASAAD
ncbi:hypothetical protein CRENBAI_025820 [Crenichthys baileyi]|uniref:Uncharacterized protein n=1 Tax=Crenichthys baileyi TaxID=28760 RepID=A0AAV9R4R3_9TELE